MRRAGGTSAGWWRAPMGRSNAGAAIRRRCSSTAARTATTCAGSFWEDEMARLEKLLTIDEVKRVAERRVPKMFFQYADSGAYTESSYRANSEDFHKVRLEQRVGGD